MRAAMAARSLPKHNMFCAPVARRAREFSTAINAVLNSRLSNLRHGQDALRGSRDTNSRCTQRVIDESYARIYRGAAGRLRASRPP